jgi:hypothetical protein
VQQPKGMLFWFRRARAWLSTGEERFSVVSDVPPWAVSCLARGQGPRTSSRG